MLEIKTRGERAIRSDVIARKHGLSQRQGLLVDVLAELGSPAK